MSQSFRIVKLRQRQYVFFSGTHETTNSTINFDITRQIGDFKLDENKKMTVSSSNKFNTDTGIVSGFQLYEIYVSGKLTEKRTLEINFKPVSDPGFKKLINQAGLEISEIYGDYSKNEFFEQTSDFMIYKLIKKRTKA